MAMHESSFLCALMVMGADETFSSVVAVFTICSIKAVSDYYAGSKFLYYDLTS